MMRIGSYIHMELHCSNVTIQIDHGHSTHVRLSPLAFPCDSTTRSDCTTRLVDMCAFSGQWHDISAHEDDLQIFAYLLVCRDCVNRSAPGLSLSTNAAPAASTVYIWQ